MSQSPLHVKVTVVTALAVMVLASAPSVSNQLQWGIAQEERQPQQQQQQTTVM